MAELWVDLPSGGRAPALGLGTWTGQGDDFEKALETALELGYRHIDTATLYNNEKFIGNVLKRWISVGKIKREDLFIVTKLPTFGNRPSGVEKYLKKSLDDLQLDYVDLYLVHGPFAFPDTDNIADPVSYDKDGYALIDTSTDLVAVWKAMEEQVTKGRTKAIGLSNYNKSQIQRILDICKIKPANLQIEIHLYLQQNELVEFCKSKGITVTAFSSLGTTGGLQVLKNQGKYLEPKEPLKDKDVLQLAEKYKKTPAQILLKHIIQKGIMAIPKSTNPQRLKQNISLFDWTLSDEDMTLLNSLDRGEAGRIIDFAKLQKGLERHPEYPFK